MAVWYHEWLTGSSAPDPGLKGSRLKSLRSPRQAKPSEVDAAALVLAEDAPELELESRVREASR